MTQDPLVRRPSDTGSFLAWVLFGIVDGIGLVSLGVVAIVPIAIVAWLLGSRLAQPGRVG